jgi:hypothetical protein
LTKDVKAVLWLTSGDEDTTVKVIIVRIALEGVSETIAVDFAKAASVGAISIDETEKAKAVVAELRMLQRDTRNSIKRKLSNTVSSDVLDNLVRAVWPPVDEKKISRQEKLRRKEAGTAAQVRFRKLPASRASFSRDSGGY